MGYKWDDMQFHFVYFLAIILIGLFVYQVMARRTKDQLEQNTERLNKLLLSASTGDTQDATADEEKIVAVFNDIIKQKMESSSGSNQEILSLAAELAHLGSWKFHPDSGLFEFGEEFYAIFGTTVAQEGAFKTHEEYFRDFVHPDDRWLFELPDIQKKYIHRIIRKDGEVRIVAVQGNIVKDSAGKIVNWYGATQDVTEHKQAEAALSQKAEQIHQIAYTDALTGLPNRIRLTEWLDNELKHAHTGEATGCIIFIDLDDLKTVNDTVGHTCGDAIIIEAADRIINAVFEGAFVGRFGGDEFIVVFPGLIDRQGIVSIADKLIHSLHQDVGVQEEIFRLSASIGIAVYPSDGATSEELIKNVDNAMYYAKNFGKNCWKFYDQQMQTAAYEKMLLTKKLHHAIENNEFSLVYQPQVAIQNATVIGFEALLRWTTEEDGPIPPSVFIPVAEHNGLIKAIGNWVLQEACCFARRLADDGWDKLYVAVNVSPHQLRSEQFIATVHDAIQKAGIHPCQLEIEITENALIVSLKEAIAQLNALKAMGVRLALDDFGTGYSSLTYLQQLPVQTLKIDKSFIDMILESSSKKAIISTIVDLAHQMNMTVVAEGVETADQLAYLSQTRCDLVQGYFFSRPVPEADARRFLLPH